MPQLIIFTNTNAPTTLIAPHTSNITVQTGLTGPINPTTAAGTGPAGTHGPVGPSPRP